MAPPEPPSEVTIRVKVPPGHIQGTHEDEFTLGSVSTSQPISTLRQRIQTLVPSNPAPVTQRILYGGRALVDDSQTVADALNTRRDPTQTEYVMHLLIRPVSDTARGGNGGQTVVAPGPPAQGGGMRQQLPPWVQPGIQTTTSAIPAQAQAPLDQHRPHHVHPHGQPLLPARPVSSSGFHIQGTGPDGRAFAIHQQFVTNGASQPIAMPHPVPGMPQMQLPGMHAGLPQFGLPALPVGMPALPMPAPNMAPQVPLNSPAVSALDRARENMSEMRRMLEELRNENAASDATRTRIAELEQRMQAVNDYIDPFRIGRRGSRPASPTPAPRSASVPQSQPVPQPPLSLPIPGLPPHFNMPMMPLQQMQMPHMPQLRQMQPLSNDRTSVYLLSGPQGPHALLFSPQHGAYTGNTFHQQIPVPSSTLSPTTGIPVPTPTQPAPVGAPEAENAVQVIPEAAANQAGLAQLQAQADPMAFFQPVLGHAWLLLRIMVFAYIVMGSNMGWRRPIAVALIGLGFWLIRLGLFGNGGLIRRWWDGVIHIDRGAQAQAAAPQPQGEDHLNAHAPEDARIAATTGRLPSPEEYAQRLIREQRERSPLHRLREQIRPAERALALFVASLWPGVGERYVQALDRAREEEEAARRAIEAQREEAARAEQQASEEAEKKTGVAESSSQGGKQDLGEPTAAAVATEAADQ